MALVEATVVVLGRLAEFWHGLVATLESLMEVRLALVLETAGVGATQVAEVVVVQSQAAHSYWAGSLYQLM